jgi:hypothetical protein
VLSLFSPHHLYRFQEIITKLIASERNAEAPQIALVGDILVVSFMTDEDTLEGVWHKNANVKIITSNDKGLTWEDKLLVADKPAAWAGFLALNETNFLVLYDHERRTEAQQVALV